MSEEEKRTQSTSESKSTKSENDSSIYYILGGVVLVAAIAGFFLLKPKPPAGTPAGGTQTAAQKTVAPTPAPITAFACEKQYYNPVVGFPKFFLSMEGVDTATSGNVNCEFEVTVKDKVIATVSAKGAVSAAPSRNGGTFRCQSNEVELARNVASTIKVTATNEAGDTIECSQDFVFP